MSRNSESLQRPGEGRHTSAPSPQTHPGRSDLCDQHGIHPTMFYRWQKEFFENAAAAFDAPLPPPQRRQGPEDRPAGTKDCNASTKSSPNSWRNISN